MKPTSNINTSAKSEKNSATSNKNALVPLPPSVPLTPSETESLRKEMSEAMDWMEKELAKNKQTP
jgi:hypothetical protein